MPEPKKNTLQAFAGAVGICAAGAVGKVVMDQVNKKQTESMRSMLSSQAGIDIDASILDEVLSTLSPPPRKRGRQHGSRALRMHMQRGWSVLAVAAPLVGTSRGLCCESQSTSPRMGAFMPFSSRMMASTPPTRVRASLCFHGRRRICSGGGGGGDGGSGGGCVAAWW